MCGDANLWRWWRSAILFDSDRECCLGRSDTLPTSVDWQLPTYLAVVSAVACNLCGACDQPRRFCLGYRPRLSLRLDGWIPKHLHGEDSLSAPACKLRSLFSGCTGASMIVVHTRHGACQILLSRTMSFCSSRQRGGETIGPSTTNQPNRDFIRVVYETRGMLSEASCVHRVCRLDSPSG